jgi:hypothetical protein
VLGSIWVGTILQLKELQVNSTFDYAASCGVRNYPQTPLPDTATRPTRNSIFILFGTIVAACLLAILITLLFVDDVKDDELHEGYEKADGNKPKPSKFVAISKKKI